MFPKESGANVLSQNMFWPRIETFLAFSLFQYHNFLTTLPVV